MIVTENKLLSTIPRGQGQAGPCMSTWGNTKVSQETEGVRGKGRQNFHVVFVGRIVEVMYTVQD